MRLKQKTEFYSQLLLLGLAVLVLFFACYGSNQASSPFLMPIEWQGVYSFDGENWGTLEKGKQIAGAESEVILRLQPNMDIEPGNVISFYLNHIGFSIYEDGGKIYDSYAEYDAAEDDMCGKQWISYLSEGLTTEEEIEIHLNNPHKVGSGRAYLEFIENSYAVPNEMVAVYLEKQNNGWRYIGLTAMALSFILMGICVATALLKITIGMKFRVLSMIMFFMGGYIYLDTIDALLRMEPMVFHTYAVYFCQMFANYEAGVYVKHCLTEKRQKVGRVALAILAAGNFSCILAAFFTELKMYDTFPIWCILQAVITVIMVACGIGQLKYKTEERNFLILILFFMSTFVFEGANVFGGWIRQGQILKLVFVGLLIFLFAGILKVVPEKYRAALEAERLGQELKNNRTVLALSQIRTHFIFNVLNAISGMCKYAPEKADDTVVCFARYLRKNIDIFEKDEPVLFTEDLEHVEDYVALEQMRFGDKIQFKTEIGISNFRIPQLILQPLIENAIKHGLSPKKEGGTILLKTYEEKDRIVILIEDDGVGYGAEGADKDEIMKALPTKKGTGVALENIRTRLKYMVNGTLEIKGKRNEGTVVMLTIPKEEKK